MSDHELRDLERAVSQSPEDIYAITRLETAAQRLGIRHPFVEAKRTELVGRLVSAFSRKSGAIPGFQVVMFIDMALSIMRSWVENRLRLPPLPFRHRPLPRTKRRYPAAQRTLKAVRKQIKERDK